MPAGEALHRVAQGLRRAARLRCPRCGGAPLFRGWFAMNDVCAVCDLRFERAQGYWIGAIYVNYGVTTLIAVVLVTLTRYWARRSQPWRLETFE